jgi:hypothetical protein
MEIFDKKLMVCFHCEQSLFYNEEKKEIHLWTHPVAPSPVLSCSDKTYSVFLYHGAAETFVTAINEQPIFEMWGFTTPTKQVEVTPLTPYETLLPLLSTKYVGSRNLQVVKYSIPSWIVAPTILCGISFKEIPTTRKFYSQDQRFGLATRVMWGNYLPLLLADCDLLTPLETFQVELDPHTNKSSEIKAATDGKLPTITFSHPKVGYSAPARAAGRVIP